jgi:hypothetical protein
MPQALGAMLSPQARACGVSRRLSPVGLALQLRLPTRDPVVAPTSNLSATGKVHNAGLLNISNTNTLLWDALFYCHARRYDEMLDALRRGPTAGGQVR